MMDFNALEQERERLTALSYLVLNLEQLREELLHLSSQRSVTHVLEQLKKFGKEPLVCEAVQVVALRMIEEGSERLISQGVDYAARVVYPDIVFTGIPNKDMEPGRPFGYARIPRNSYGAVGYAAKTLSCSTGRFRILEDGVLELAFIEELAEPTSVGVRVVMNGAGEETHWNPPSSPLPPVESPLLIKIPAGTRFTGDAVCDEDIVVKAQRTQHLRDRDGIMEYVTPEGMRLKGQFYWTHA